MADDPRADDPPAEETAAVLRQIPDAELRNEIRELSRVINQRTDCQEKTRRLLEREWDRRLAEKAQQEGEPPMPRREEQKAREQQEATLGMNGMTEAGGTAAGAAAGALAGSILGPVGTMAGAVAGGAAGNAAADDDAGLAGRNRNRKAGEDRPRE